MVPALLAIQGLPVGPDSNEQEIQLQIFTAPLGLGGALHTPRPRQDAVWPES